MEELSDLIEKVINNLKHNEDIESVSIEDNGSVTFTYRVNK